MTIFCPTDHVNDYFVKNRSNNDDDGLIVAIRDRFITRNQFQSFCSNNTLPGVIYLTVCLRKGKILLPETHYVVHFSILQVDGNAGNAHC
jgi:hypothetical protein